MPALVEKTETVLSDYKTEISKCEVSSLLPAKDNSEGREGGLKNNRRICFKESVGCSTSVRLYLY